MNNQLASTTNWVTLYDDRCNSYDVKFPYTIPPGVNSVLIQLALDDEATKATPKVYIDDIEMVEAP